MEIEKNDSNCELNYEEMKQKLKALEEENRTLQLQTMKYEQGLAASGKLLLSSFRIFNVNAEVAKLVGCLLKTRENLEQTLAKASIQFDHIHVLEREVNDLNEKLMEIKAPGFPSSILASFKEWKKASATEKPLLAKTLSAFLGPTNSVKVESIGNFIIGITVSHLWNAVSFGLNNADALCGLQGALIASLLLKILSDEKEKLALQELPASTKMVLSGLSCHIRDLEPLASTADKLDQVLYKGLGMSLYSDEFRELCLRNKFQKSDTKSKNLDKFILTLRNDNRENLFRIMSDKQLEKPLETLAEVVWNETFLRASALYQASKLLGTLPGFLNKCDDYVLDAVQFACHQVLPSNDNETEKSSLKKIADGIVKMRNDYKKITDLYSP